MLLDSSKIYHILCTERTGSTLLYEYLINFNFKNFKNITRPRFALDGELFRPDILPLNEALQYVRAELINNVHVIIKFMPAHLDEKYEKSFLSFYNQSPYCFLKLERKDKWRQLLSYLIAVYCHYDSIKTHEFARSKETIKFNNKIINEIDNFKNKLKWFDNCKIDNYQNIYYEDLINNIDPLSQGSYNLTYDNFSKINYEEKFENLNNIKEYFYDEE